MLSLRQNKSLQLLVTCGKCYTSRCQSRFALETPEVESEYTEKPEYPEIQDLSFRSRKEREAKSWHDQIRAVPTIEEKLIKINMPRYYGYKVVMLGEKYPYNCLPATQHYTRTVLESIKPSLSAEGEQDASQQLDSYVQQLKGGVQDVIEFAHDFLRLKYPDDSQLDKRELEDIYAQSIVEQLNRILINSLVATIPHLGDVCVDYNPRHEGFWFVGGIHPPKNVVKSKEGREWQKEMAQDSVNRLMQYIHTPLLALRHQHQLPTWKNGTEVENLQLAKEIPRYDYDPRTLGYVTGHRHGTNIPGFWPGSDKVFGTVLFESRSYLQTRPAACGEEDRKESLHAKAIQSSYAWLLAQANYNGFNTFNDITYPMNTQTIITDGRIFSFYEYQLNTLLVHSRHVDENPRMNFCRGTDEMQLYHEVDKNGKCIGFNEEVLRHLIKFYINNPSVKRSDSELQPYLHPEIKRVAQYKDPEQREFLDKVFKHMCSNRPRHLPLPEIYLWEKIYKIDHNTRPLEARRRFFELNINPWKRTLDQHQKEYIPKAVRPEGPKSRNKWKKTFYP